MAKTTREMIEIMQHFANGGEVEYVEKGHDDWGITRSPIWDWHDYDYRIKEPKQKVTIEKWLIEEHGIKFMIENSDINYWLKGFPSAKKLKLIERYTIEI